MTDIPKTVEALIERIHELESENLNMAERISTLKKLKVELEETNINNVANYQLQVKDLEQQHKSWKVLESDIVFEQLQKQNAELSAANKAANDIIGAQANANDKLVAQLSAAIKVKDVAFKNLIDHCSTLVTFLGGSGHMEAGYSLNQHKRKAEKALSLTPPDALKEYLKQDNEAIKS